MQGGMHNKVITGPMGKRMLMGCFQGIVEMCNTYGKFSRRAKVGKERHPSAWGRNNMRKYREWHHERGWSCINKLHFSTLVQPNPVPNHCSLFYLPIKPNS